MNLTVAGQHGQIVLIDEQEPLLRDGHVRIRTAFSALSPGTEMTMAGHSGAEAVALGYSAAGVIEQVGGNVTHLHVGQRVACYGAPYVRHAQVLAVPANLVAPVPDHVSLEEAAFVGLGAIAIHALRIADMRFGEQTIVVGLGILGNLIAQIAHAAAYGTIGLDLLPARVAALQRQGVDAVDSMEQVNDHLAQATNGQGADSVILCASGNGQPLIDQGLDWIRNRGKVVIVGDLTMAFSRNKMFAKEAQVLISRAGGPGRYDATYERDNIDYPAGFVRWTEGRNVAEYIRLLAAGRIQVKPLIGSVHPVEQAEEAFAAHRQPTAIMGSLLQYTAN